MSDADHRVNRKHRKSRKYSRIWEAHRVFTPYEQTVIRGWIDSYWLPFLTPSEWKALSMILSRTVSWGKTWEHIPLRHFQNGVARASFDGDRDNPVTAKWFHGVGMSRPTTIKALGRLAADGFIIQEWHGDCYRYSLDFDRLATMHDPVFSRIPADAVCRETQAKVCEITGAGGKEFLPYNIENTHSYGMEVSDETYRAQEDFDMGFLPERRKGKPAYDEDGEMTTPPRRSDAAAAPGAKPHAADPRIRGAVTEDVTNARLLDTVRRRRRADTADDPAPAPNAAALIKPTGNRVIDQRRREGFEAQALKNRKGKETISKIVNEWTRTAGRTYGRTITDPFTPKQKFALRRMLDNVVKPDPGIRWADVVEWYIREFGTAASAAFPFMLKDQGKREDILHAHASHTLFTRFGAEVIAAYAAAFMGEGLRPDVLQRGKAWQTEHDRWCKRKAQAARAGYGAVDADLLTADELMRDASALESEDAEVRDLARQSEVLRQISRGARGSERKRRKETEQAEMRMEYKRRLRARGIDPDAGRNAGADQEPDLDDYYNGEL